MFAIPMLLYDDPLGPFDPHFTGTLLIYAAVAMTVISMFYYLKMAWPEMIKHQ